MTAFYSEFDPKAAAWLRELIKRGLIADGIVDERDLWDISPADLRGFAQVHLCAGIGVWSYALRRAGWPDDRQVWTASFPCQPFSAAGKGAGFADERHLWPAGHYLIEKCQPAVIFGEQVASKDGLNWLDLVQADLEGAGYASGAVDLCAAGFGAPHIRQRLYWVAERMADDGSQRRQQDARSASGDEAAHGRSGWVGGEPNSDHIFAGDGSDRDPGPVNGIWRDADWLFCRDGKWRPVEASTQPLVDGVAGRVGRGSDLSPEQSAQSEIGFPIGKDSEARVARLRGYGNAIVAVAAQGFIEAYLSI